MDTARKQEAYQPEEPGLIDASLYQRNAIEGADTAVGHGSHAVHMPQAVASNLGQYKESREIVDLSEVGRRCRVNFADIFKAAKEKVDPSEVKKFIKNLGIEHQLLISNSAKKNGMKIPSEPINLSSIEIRNEEFTELLAPYISNKYNPESLEVRVRAKNGYLCAFGVLPTSDKNWEITHVRSLAS